MRLGQNQALSFNIMRVDSRANTSETLEELSGPLVHTNFPRKRYGPMLGPY